MNIKLAFLLLIFLLGLLFSCACDSPSPTEHLQFTNSKILTIENTFSMPTTRNFGVVDVLWDSQGNIILAAYFLHKVYLNKPYICQPEKNCSFVAKLNGLKFEWVVVYSHQILSIAVDQKNDIIISTTEELRKISDRGATLWKKSLLNISLCYLAVDKEENIIAAGSFTKIGKIDDFLFPKASEQGENIVLKLDSHGRPLWIEMITKHTSDFALTLGLAVDTEGNIITHLVSNSGKYDSVLIKLDKNKKLLWKKTLFELIINFVETSNIGVYDRHLLKNTLVTDSYYKSNMKLIFDQQGNLIVGLLGYGLFSYSEFSQKPQMSLLKINSDGRVLWLSYIKLNHVEFNDNPFAIIHQLRTDPDNNIYVVGTVLSVFYPRGTPESNPNTVYFGSISLSPVKNVSPFISKLSSTGEFLWAFLFDIDFQPPEHHEKLAFDLRPNSQHSVVFAGVFNNAALFPLNPPLALQGNNDIFVFTADLTPTPNGR